MKYALVGGERSEPQPKLAGVCISCASLMVAKCGVKKIHHWAHKTLIECDHVSVQIAKDLQDKTLSVH
ncbi:MAG: hypothetical protein EOP04_21425 [Proteobacteria bacterium]|nr:MAG: hypothetical protein EOP04_21425 [Pseudomonadota bacterium]